MKAMRCLLALIVCLGITGVLRGADVNYFGVVKSAFYQQTSSGSPTAVSSNGFSFDAFVVGSSAEVVTNASVHISSSGVVKILLPDSNQETWRFSEFFNTQSALDTAYPSGSLFSPVNYAMTIGTVNDGVKSPGNLSFATILTQPPTPQITNWTEAQVIDTTRDFTLRWSPTGNSVDILQITILDMASNVVYASPLPFSSGALTGNSSSFVIPANVLPGGTNCQGHLSIARPGLPITTYATGVPALLRDTAFNLTTRPLPAQPQITILSSPGEPLALSFNTENNRIYHLLTTTNFLSWADVLVTNATGNPVTYTNSNNDSNERYFEVRVGP